MSDNLIFTVNIWPKDTSSQWVRCVADVRVGDYCGQVGPHYYDHKDLTDEDIDGLLADCLGKWLRDTQASRLSVHNQSLLSTYPTMDEVRGVLEELGVTFAVEGAESSATVSRRIVMSPPKGVSLGDGDYREISRALSQSILLNHPWQNRGIELSLEPEGDMADMCLEVVCLDHGEALAHFNRSIPVWVHVDPYVCSQCRLLSEDDG